MLSCSFCRSFALWFWFYELFNEISVEIFKLNNLWKAIPKRLANRFPFEHSHTQTFLIAVYIQVKSQQFLSVALCLLCDFSVEITQLCATAARQSKWNESEKKSLELWPLKCNLFNQVCVCVYASASAALLAITANVHFVHFAYTNTHRRHNHTTVFTYSSLHVIRCAVGGKVVCRLLTIFQTKSTGKRFTIVHPSEDCQQYFLRPVD